MMQDQDAGLKERCDVSLYFSASTVNVYQDILEIFKRYKCPTFSPRDYDSVGQKWILSLVFFKKSLAQSCIDGVENKHRFVSGLSTDTLTI